MKKKQIKHILIDINTAGSKEALAAVGSINKELVNVQQSAKEAGGFIKGPTKAMESLHKVATATSTAFNTVGDDVRSMNRALNGNTVKAEKGLSGYMDNLELLTISLKEVATQSSIVAADLGKIDSSMGTGRTVVNLTQIESSLDAMVVQLASLVKGSFITTKRLKETREGITDMGVSANRTAEELDDMANSARGSDQSIFGLGGQAGKTKKGVEALGRTAGRTGKHLGKMASGGFGIVGVYATIAANVYAVTEAFRILQEAANFDRLTENLGSFSAAVSGINVKGLAEEMSVLSGSILSVKESMQFATKGAAFNFTAEQLKNLTVGARKASIALGRDFSDSMDRVMRGISKQEIELFDELGVVTRLTPAFQKYADSVNKTIDELSDYERQLALTNEVQGQLDARFAGIESKATSFEVLSKAVLDFKDVTLIALTQALDPFAKALADLVPKADPLQEALGSVSTTLTTMNKSAEGTNLGIMVTAFGELQESVSRAGREVRNSNGELSTLETELETGGKMALVAVVAFIAIATAMVKAKAAAIGLSGALAMHPVVRILSLIGAGIAAFYAYSDSMNDNGEAMKDNEAKTRDLAKAKMLLVEAEASLESRGVNTTKLREDTLAQYKKERDAIISKLQAAKALEKQLQRKRPSIKRAAPGSDLYKQQRKNWKERKAAQELQIKLRTELNKLSKDGAVAKVFAEQGGELKAFTNSLRQAERDITNFANTATVVKSSYSSVLASTAAMMKVPEDSDGDKISGSVTEATDSFNNLKKELVTSGVAWAVNIESAEELYAVLLNLHKKEIDIKQTRVSTAAENQRSMLHQVDGHAALLAIEVAYLAELKKTGGADYDKQKIVTDNMRTQGNYLAKVNTFRVASLALSRNQELLDLKSAGSGEKKSDSLQRELDYASSAHAINLSVNKLQDQALRDAESAHEHDKARLKILKGQAEQLELQAAAVAKLKHEQSVKSTGKIRGKAFDAAFGRPESAVANNMEKQDDLKDKGDMQNLQLESLQAVGGDDGVNSAAILALKDAIAGTNEELAVTKDLMGMAEVTDLSSKVDRLKASLTNWDLTDLQTTFLDTFQTIEEGVGRAREAFKALDKDGEGDMFDGLALGFKTLFGGVEKGTEESEKLQVDAMDATVKTVQATAEMGMSVFNELSAGKIAGFDREIEAEKRKDGKSVESLAKIKRLEGKKIKEQAKAKKAAVLMSTSMAIMETFATYGATPQGFGMAAAMAAMGMLQLSNIDKAKGGQLAALDAGGGAGGLKITGGTRDNSVDVSKAASAGEFAFATGSTAPGRAGGGFSGAGTSIMVGEQGPELITPAIPVNVTSAGNSKGTGGSGITFAPVFNAQAIDASGMEALFQNYSKELYDGLQRELEANNQTLESL